jgi:hypothetical protein
VRSLRTNNHTLPSHLRLYSLFVASYDSQGLRWRYSNPPPQGVSLSGGGESYGEASSEESKVQSQEVKRVEGKEQFRVEVSNRFAALEDLEAEECINSDWEGRTDKLLSDSFLIQNGLKQ